MYTMNILIVFLCILIFIPFIFSLSLYSPEDPLHELDSSNFESVVLSKSNAWIIEFYNNWCGHCIRYAPTWKRFSSDIRSMTVLDILASHTFFFKFICTILCVLVGNIFEF